MPEASDFERAWLAKFARCLEAVAGKETRKEVMAGSEALTSQSSRQEVIAWTQEAMQRLAAAVPEQHAQEIMAGCACQYPKAELSAFRQEYEATQDLDRVHRMLQERFESFLEESLALDSELVQEVLSRGWGLAGVKEGDRIIATKIPKSSYLAEYLKETNPDRRRQYYCHCPRVRDALQTSESLPTTYCYCGAGYYKGIWEEILQSPVEVQVLESVLQGDEVCKIAIHLPSEAFPMHETCGRSTNGISPRALSSRGGLSGSQE